MGRAGLHQCREIQGDVPAQRRGSGWVLGRGGETHRLAEALHQGEEHQLRIPERLGEMVRGRRPQHLRQLHRPPSEGPRRPGRDPLGRRRSGGRQEDHLPRASRACLPPRQRHEGARREEGRPRDDLHADDSGGGVRDARLRADRRHPLRGLRRLLAGFPGKPHRGLPLRFRHHRRRRLARRQADSAEGQHRQGDRARREGRRIRAQRPRRPPHRRQCRDAGGPRSLVPRGDGEGFRRLSAGGDERRGSALHPLHLRLDRQAEGRAPHDRRLPRLCRDDAPLRLRLPRRRHLLVHRRCRLGDRPLLHRLRPARERRHHADVRGRAELSDRLALLGGGRQARRQHLLHRADRDPRADGRRRRAT